MVGEVVGIIALIAVFVLFSGLILNHRRVRDLRDRRDELDNRMAGLEARAAQLAETDRQHQAARRRAARQPAHGAPAHSGVRRVPPLRVGR